MVVMEEEGVVVIMEMEGMVVDDHRQISSTDQMVVVKWNPLEHLIVRSKSIDFFIFVCFFYLHVVFIIGFVMFFFFFAVCFFCCLDYY